jgi:Protein of unknown function DUF262
MADPEQKTDIDEDPPIEDDADADAAVAPENYAISSFGIDFDVEGLVRRLRKDQIFVPHFQRNFVWKQKEASQFIESLLLGLPVPGVFLAKERDSERLMIIDGQQRLKTLQFFYDGFFRPDDNQKKKQVFELTEVQPEFAGKTYGTLTEDEKGRLDNSVLHATIIKQESPREEEDTSLYYVFGRLNTGGRKLSPQEVRTAIYHGPLSDLIESLNAHKTWRTMFGKENERLKDQELILRFLALRSGADYFRPMEEFLNQFSKRNQKPTPEFLADCERSFKETIDAAYKYFGVRGFRPVRAINAAIFDSVAIGLSRRLARGPIVDAEAAKTAHAALFKDNEYLLATGRATSDESSVDKRIRIATEAFATLT